MGLHPASRLRAAEAASCIARRFVNRFLMRHGYPRPMRGFPRPIATRVPVVGLQLLLAAGLFFAGHAHAATVTAVDVRGLDETMALNVRVSLSLVDAIGRDLSGRRLARLRPQVDAFFDKVMVNVDDIAVRNNRLALLKRLSDRLGSVAAIEHLSV